MDSAGHQTTHFYSFNSLALIFILCSCLFFQVKKREADLHLQNPHPPSPSSKPQDATILLFISLHKIVISIPFWIFSCVRALLQSYRRGLVRLFELLKKEVGVWGVKNVEYEKTKWRVEDIICSARNNNNNNDDIIDKCFSSASSEGEEEEGVGTKLFLLTLDLHLSGICNIVDDQVIPRIEPSPLEFWNLLTREWPLWTNTKVTFKLRVIWILGFIFRHFVLLPFRVAVGAVCLITIGILTGFIGPFVPESVLPCKQVLMDEGCKLMFRCICGANGIMKFHDTHNKPRGNGICVANHTSPMTDVFALFSQMRFTLTGQQHNGFFGLMQNTFAKSYPHIWFERKELKQRQNVLQKLKEHVETNKDAPPILLFPEGVCTNNTAVLRFRKGALELDTTIYPVALKYDQRFGDPFWNMKQKYLLHHIFAMITSWTIVCEIFYLPPMRRLPSESAPAFAARVQAAIAEKAGLEIVDWGGGNETASLISSRKVQYQKATGKLILNLFFNPKKKVVDEVVVNAKMIF